ncbi:pyridoxal phosphate-dependent aminotransferase [Paenibacillus flagellatus]|uniref:Aminotransferase n=1 Tax=Paenibacillus flagellatus TaxID=2211139 RepID=A0A2V5KAL8_9BACL|nr:aminotransferase class I/II-fold pyridoxal phosphate-dependent enzyme [Paenibacillus flagellatus]PYI55952.1 aminotransferase A [Paenibacillus flagellatus]
MTRRVRDIPPSGIRAFFERSGENPDTISLGIGEPDFVTPEHVRAACIRALHEGKTKYTPNAGLYELREEIASYLHDGFGLHYEPANEMLVTVGTSEAVDLALRVLVEPGDEVLIHTPCYIAYSPLAHLHGARVVEVQTTAEERFKLTARALAESLTPRSKVLVVNFPNNPTGAVMTEDDWRPVAELAVRNDLIVISDEVYAELAYGTRHVSIASLPGMKERTIVINGFSKAFAMTGWRIGYACGGRELIGGMLKIHQYTAMCAPVLGQIAAMESLRNGQAAKEAMKAAFDERRRTFVGGLRAIGLPCHEPQGAFYAFPSIAHTGLTSERFARLLLEEAGVAVVPGHVFGTGGEGHIRCSYAVSAPQLAEALARMERFVSVPEQASSR